MDGEGRTGHRPDECPQCGGRRVRRNVSPWTAAILAGFLLADIAALVAAPAIPGDEHSRPVMLFAVAALLTPFAVGAAIGAAFGRNACRDCGHRWR